MKAAVRRIDRALKKLYNIEVNYRAEQFLVTRPATGPSSVLGSLFIKQGKDLQLGIYLHPTIGDALPSLRNWNSAQWTGHELNAFCVAAEEVSHFLMLLQRMTNQRSVTQLELEVQAEIDKFVLAYFSKPEAMKKKTRETFFEALFEKLFERFKLADHLTPEQKTRYLEANEVAKRFIKDCGTMLIRTEEQSENLLRVLRQFYLASREEKLRRK